MTYQTCTPIPKLRGIARAEALAHRLDEIKPGYYDAFREAYKIRKLEQLSGCEISGVIAIMEEDLLQLEHYRAMREATEDEHIYGE